MAVTNERIISALKRIADLLDIQGENQFKVRSYRSAADTIKSLSREVSDVLAEGMDLTNLEGIGETLAEKIETIVKTGTHPKLSELESNASEAVLILLEADGFGAKKINQLVAELSLSSRADLERALTENKISGIDGFGEKSEDAVAAALARYSDMQDLIDGRR